MRTIAVAQPGCYEATGLARGGTGGGMPLEAASAPCPLSALPVLRYRRSPVLRGRQGVRAAVLFGVVDTADTDARGRPRYMDDLLPHRQTGCQTCWLTGRRYAVRRFRHRRLPQRPVPLVCTTVATLADIAAGRHSIDAELMAARRHGHKSDRPVGNDRMLSSRDGRPARW